MKIKRIQEKGSKLLAFVLLAALSGIASAAWATYSLPTARSVTWQGNVGVSGDIPSRTTIYKTLSPSGGDDTSAIQTAIDNCPTGQVVKLNAGTFKISTPMTISRGITLRGAGMGSTIIQGQASATGAYLVKVGGGISFGTSYGITAGLTKGSTTITTSAAHGWSVGDVIWIDQLNNASDDPPVSSTGNNGACTWCGRSSGSRSLGQAVKVTAVPTSTTATLEIPLYWNYDASLTPQATKMGGILSSAGIENLTIDNSISGSSSQITGTIWMSGTGNCWLLNTEVISAYHAILELDNGAYRNTIRSCKFHEGVPVTAGDGSSSFATDRAYGINPLKYCSANLFENNQMFHLSTGLLSDGPFSGNVIAYNYITGLYLNNIDFDPYAISFHGSHAFMNLEEGNYIDSRVASDFVFGTKSDNTVFRNKIAIAPNRSGGAWDLDIQNTSWYFNIVGNVLGKGTERIYTLINTDSGSSAIYRLGYTADGDNTASGNDAGVGNTILRHANWDSYTNGVVWNGSDDHVLPPSLYLSSKPSWWNSLPWPAIGPDVSPMYPAAPVVGSGTPWNNKSITPPTLLGVN